MTNRLNYLASVCYTTSIEGFGSVVTQVQNLSPRNSLQGVSVIYMGYMVKSWFKDLTSNRYDKSVFYFLI